MTRTKYTLLLAIAFLIIAPKTIATTRKVLFIGNSYTFTNSMPTILQSIATAMGDTLIFDQSDPGGYTMMQHCTYAPTITKIFSQPWDIVVIQDQSELPSFPPSQVATDVYPYAHILDSMVHANDTCTQTMFMMTWGHANGDPANCGSYPVICTYNGMQARLRESYLQMAIDNNADVAPVGAAFKVCMDSAYTPWLYSPDSSHPAMAGSYLEACVLYASIFHRNPQGCSYLSGLAATDAALMQRIARKVTLDSISLWQQHGHYPYAGLTNTTSGPSVNFTSLSPVACSNLWSFGDGVTDTAHNPHHTYATPGEYHYTHTVTTPCFTETITDSVHIAASTSVASVSGQEGMVSIWAEGNGRFLMNFTSIEIVKVLIFNSLGRLVSTIDAAQGPVREQWTPGLYIYKAYNRDGSQLVTGKMSIY
jgi:hypothetical protein